MSSKSKPASAAQLSDAKHFNISLAIAVAIIIPISSLIERTLAPAIGVWGALGVCLLTAAAIGGIVATAVNFYYKRRERN